MTVSSTTTKNSYSGDGSTTTFAYALKIFADADLTVILRSSTGTETVQSLTTNYTVTNAGNANGGNVVFGTAPASGVTVVIRRNMAQTQSTDYVANDPFPAATHEDALDRLTFIDQQQQEEVDRSIKLSRTNTMTSTEFTVGATDRANKVLAFDGNGELSVTQELGTYKGTDATVTTEAYVVRDIIKSTTTAQLNNVYICVANAVVGDSLTDTDHFELLVDAVSAATSATNAANSASAASTSETNAATSESNASTSETNASNAQTAAETAQSAAEIAQTAAETAQTAAETALDTFDDRFLGAKASDPTVDNDGNALIDGALYFDTTNDIMKVYDLTNTTWRQLTLTSANQTNVNTVAGQISPTNNIATVAGADTNIGLVAGSIANVNTTASNIANVNSVAGNESNINSAVSNESNINAVVSNASNINAVAGNASNINAVSSDITNVNTVATNISSVNNFADVYRIASSAPTTSLDLGDLYFDTTSDTLKVYGASGWQSAGSSVNGTSQRYHYDITGTPLSVTGVDDNGNTLTYDAGYVDVYVNGVRMSDADIIITSGDTVTFTEALAHGDEVDIVAYGTFSVASLNADNLDSGTVPDARITGAYTGITNLTMSGDLTVDTNTLYVDSANNRVGVGTVSPSDNLHLAESGATSSFIRFSNSNVPNGWSLGSHNSGRFQLTQNGVADRIIVDSSGNLLVGKTSTGAEFPGITLGSSGYASFTRDSNISLFLNRETNDGTIVEFRKDNTAVGSIGTSNGDLYIGTGDTGLRFHDGDNSIYSVNATTGAKINGAVDLGEPAGRFKDLYLSGGVNIKGSTPKITLEHSNENGTAQIYTTAQSAIILDADPDNTDNGTPIQFKIDGNEVGRFDSGGRFIAPYGVTLGTSAGTYSAGNTLDDYEEGTWTPAYQGVTTAGTYTLGEAQGTYTKIGNMVIAHVNITNITTVSAGSGNVEITGLPFSIGGNPSGFNTEQFGNVHCNLHGIGSNQQVVILYTTSFQIFKTNTASTTNNVNVTDKSSNSADIRGFIIYRTS